MSIRPAEAEDKFLFRDTIEEMGAEIIGTELKEKSGTSQMYPSTPTTMPLFLHLHLRDEDAAGSAARASRRPVTFRRSSTIIRACSPTPIWAGIRT